MASKPTNNSNMVRFPPWKSWSGEPERETVTKEIRKRGKKYYANCMYMSIRLGECLGTSDERLARRRLEHLKAQIERGEYQIWKRKFSDLAKTYLSEILPKKTEDCQRRYESIVRVHLLPFFGKYTMGDIANSDPDSGNCLVKMFFEKNAELPDSSLKKMARVLRDVVRIGDKSFKLPAIVYRNQGFYQSRFMSKQELESVIRCLDEKFQALALLMANTGLRLSNAVNLTWHDLRLNKNQIEVKQSKTNKFVKIPFSQTVADVFKLKARVRSLSDPRLFLFSGYSFQRAWKKAVDRSGLDWKPRPHDLRHFFCSYLLNKGVDHMQVATLSGHKDVNILKERYAHFTDETLQQAISVLDG